MISAASGFDAWLDEQTALYAGNAELRALMRERLRADTLEAWDRERRDKLRIAADLSEIGPRFAQRTFAGFRSEEGNREALAAAVAASESPRPSCAFHGPLGTGKSHLAGAIVNACIARGVPSVFTTISAMVSRIRAEMPDTDAIVSRYALMPVLCLDDLGKEQLTKWSAPMFFDLVNRRYEANLPLIVTSNLAPSGLLEHYASLPPEVDRALGPSVLDRVIEMAAPWVALRGVSKRW